MSPLPVTIPKAILDTVIGRLALLFLAGAAGDLTTAREAAHEMLAAYNPATPAELSLAAEIIGFGLHALEALGQAAGPDLSLNRILRLRGSAVSLSREAHKSQRKLDQLQRARATQQPAKTRSASQPAATQDHPKDAAVSPIETERLAAKTAAKLWLKSYHEREAAERITKNLKQNRAEHASQTAHLNGAPTTPPTTPLIAAAAA